MIEVRNSNVFRRINRSFLRRAFDFLDWHWHNAQFVPCPIRALCKECPGLTDTEALYLIMDWQNRKNGGFNGRSRS